jgi:hypothetical protein
MCVSGLQRGLGCLLGVQTRAGLFVSSVTLWQAHTIMSTPTARPTKMTVHGPRT